MNATIAIIPETKAHISARESLINQCFGAPQWDRAAHYLRQYTPPERLYSWVALQKNTPQTLVGSIRFSALILPNGQKALMLGPLAIDPHKRAQGIGKKLVQHGLKQLRADNWSGVVVIGDVSYFTKLGFSISPTEGLELIGHIAPLMLMGIEWEAGFLSNQHGTVSRIIDPSYTPIQSPPL